MFKNSSLSPAALAIGTVLAFVSAAGAQERVSRAVQAEIADSGLSRVIITMKKPRPGTRAGVAYRDPSSYLQGQMSTRSLSLVKRISDLPSVVAEINEEALEKIRRDPNVEQVIVDKAYSTFLSDVVIRLDVKKAWKSGYDGRDQVVVVLDNGVDGRHAFLRGKIVDEACFSSANSKKYKLESLCPNGGEKQFGRGAAQKCRKRLSCDHGTHVAGIIGGRGGRYKGRRLDGVARGVQVIPIQIFTVFHSAKTCRKFGTKAPCARTFISDQMEALRHVLEKLSRKYNIASINMSIGGGEFRGTCDYDAIQYTEVVDSLFDIGIPVIAAAGNNKYSQAIAHPACVSRIFSVGASKKNRRVDVGYSNASPNLDVLAIGTGVLSSVRGGYKAFNGTSMASPQVAALIALMKQANPSASLRKILATVRSTGQKVKDPRTNSMYRLINVNAALGRIAPRGRPASAEESERVQGTATIDREETVRPRPPTRDREQEIRDILTSPLR